MLLLLIHSSCGPVEVRLSSEQDFQQTDQNASYILDKPLLTLQSAIWKVRLTLTHNQRVGQQIGVRK